MKTRFCPSPTGYMHVGNLRTALFNVLAVKANQGQFLMRIEDTDLERSEAIYTTAIIEDLKWLGLDWQEGIVVGGEHAPYVQSERLDLYQQYYKALLESRSAYHCFCTEAELKLSRKRQLAAGKPPKYSGYCRNLSDAELKQKLEENIPSVLRFHVPDKGQVNFKDEVRGELSFECRDIGDFIIRRSEGMASFMFANAIDDSLMGVTHVIRGEDHLTNTPRQLLILQALKLRMPQYAHISIINGADNAPLSKRNGSKSVRELREQGYLPEAILNYLARLGHYYPDNDFLSLVKLSELFDYSKLVKSPAKFDIKQLDNWQHLAVLNLSHDQFWHALDSDLKAMVPQEHRESFSEMIKPNITFLNEAQEWIERVFGSNWTFDSEVIEHLKDTDIKFFESMIELIQAHGCDYAHISSELKELYGLKGKRLFLPLRLGLTGKSHGPELAKIFPLIGVERSVERVQRLIDQLKKV